MASTPPRNARAIHNELNQFGLVERRVKPTLMNVHNGVLEVTEVLCWLIRDRGVLKIRVTYMRRIDSILSKTGGEPEAASGTFEVSTTSPFGTVADGPLSAEDFAAVNLVATAHGI